MTITETTETTATTAKTAMLRGLRRFETIYYFLLLFVTFCYFLLLFVVYLGTVPLGDWLEKKKATAIIIKQQFGFPMSTT